MERITWKLRAFSMVIFNVTCLTGNKPLFHKIPEDVTPRVLICTAFSPLQGEACGCLSEGRERGVWERPQVGSLGGSRLWIQNGHEEAGGQQRQCGQNRRVFVPGGGVILRGAGVTHGCERWTMKKAEHRRIDAFKLWCWRRLLSVPWIARRSNQSILKEISPEYSLKGLMLKLKLQYFGYLMQRTDSLGKTLMLGRIEGRR